jgi:hypothetical protein
LRSTRYGRLQITGGIRMLIRSMLAALIAVTLAGAAQAQDGVKD